MRTHWKHLIATPSGEVQYVRRSDATTDTFYLPSDHLGSVDAVLNASATVLVRPSFDAWGGRRDEDWVGAPPSSAYDQFASTTRHGFAGHEMLDNVGLVHMNGRVYDPATGRMLSADPFVVPMLGSQGFNRYAYVGNQPLTYVDPSGFNPIDPNNPDGPGICFGFCGGIYIGDPGRNPNGPRNCPGWCVPDGDPRNNPGTGGIEKAERFTASVTADHLNVSTASGSCAGGGAASMCHTGSEVVQRIDGVRFLTETFVPGASYFNLGGEADAQGRHFAAFGWYLLGDAEVVLSALTAGMGTVITVSAGPRQLLHE